MRQLVVLARWPAAGRCKSRLAAGIGRQRAAEIQRRLTQHTLATCLKWRGRQGEGWRGGGLRGPAGGAGAGGQLVLAVDGLAPRAARRWGEELGVDRCLLQGGGGLGSRLQRQLQRAWREGARQVVLIGSDLPTLALGDLELAFAGLNSAPLVLGAATDGGYWLIGLARPAAELFCGIPWGSDQVLAATLGAANRLGLAPLLLDGRSDLDRPADLVPWRRHP
jgi:rSAM/selenodomain-associated transferase 1